MDLNCIIGICLQKIIAEQYIGCGEDLVDYKISCFHGEVKYIWVDSERFTAHKRDIFNLEWEHQPFRMTYDHAPVLPDRPKESPENDTLGFKAL